MTSVISLRLKEQEKMHIRDVARQTNKDKSTVARELIEYGWRYLVIQRYKEGRISLSKTAKELRMSISECIDFLTEFGIKSPITFEEYIAGEESLKKALRLQQVFK